MSDPFTLHSQMVDSRIKSTIETYASQRVCEAPRIWHATRFSAINFLARDAENLNAPTDPVIYLTRRLATQLPGNQRHQVIEGSAELVVDLVALQILSYERPERAPLPAYRATLKEMNDFFLGNSARSLSYPEVLFGDFAKRDGGIEIDSDSRKAFAQSVQQLVPPLDRGFDAGLSKLGIG